MLVERLRASLYVAIYATEQAASDAIHRKRGASKENGGALRPRRSGVIRKDDDEVSASSERMTSADATHLRGAAGVDDEEVRTHRARRDAHGVARLHVEGSLLLRLFPHLAVVELDHVLAVGLLR